MENGLGDRPPGAQPASPLARPKTLLLLAIFAACGVALGKWLLTPCGGPTAPIAGRYRVVPSTIAGISISGIDDVATAIVELDESGRVLPGSAIAFPGADFAVGPNGGAWELSKDRERVEFDFPERRGGVGTYYYISRSCHGVTLWMYRGDPDEGWTVRFEKVAN